jgi:hypothetical protein
LDDYQNKLPEILEAMISLSEKRIEGKGKLRCKTNVTGTNGKGKGLNTLTGMLYHPPKAATVPFLTKP